MYSLIADSGRERHIVLRRQNTYQFSEQRKENYLKNKKLLLVNVARKYQASKYN